MADVVDASVAIKWFVDEPGRNQALSVLNDVVQRPRRFCVPELFYFELANIFNRLIPCPTPKQGDLFRILLTLGIHRLAMTPDLYRALKTFQDAGLSGYDAAYVATAKQVKGVWLTFDDRAHRKIAGFNLSRLLA